MYNEEILLQTDDARVRIIELPPGAVAPRHYHTTITDNMFCLTGTIIVSMEHPADRIELHPGQRCEVDAGRLHQVANGLSDQPSTYLLVQGGGRYDFIKA